jgi:ribonuclease HII
VDEAGRGCVLGPMVMGLCTISKESEFFLKKIGVTDSKLISPKKREFLFDIIKEKAVEYKIMVVPAQELNVLMQRYSLNEIEAQKTAQMIKSLDIIPKKIILDSPDGSIKKYKERIINNLNLIDFNINNVEIITEHKADLNHISVSCGSILAKVTRDRLLEKLVGKEISGYSSDPKTINYLKDYILKNKKIPEFARSKWETIDKIMKELYQKKIGWFDGSKK